VSPEQRDLFGAPREPSLPALTFWRPWAESLVAGVKRLEFRHRPPPSTVVGVELAVVAGAHFDAGAVAWLREHCGVDWSDRDPASFPRGVVGLVTITGWRRDESNPRFGTCAWVLEHAVQIAPVACPAAHGQGVRYITGMERTLVRARAQAAREARRGG
jgi:hypothetical protein